MLRQDDNNGATNGDSTALQNGNVRKTRLRGIEQSP
jgi:hypothetical protein